MYKLSLICGLAAAAGTLASGAAADTVEMRFQDVDGQTVKFYHDGGLIHAWAGQMNWTKGDDNSGLGERLASSFHTFCIEVTEHVESADVVYEVVDVEESPYPGSDASGGSSGLGADKALLLQKLWGRHYADALTDDWTRAGFQLAIWEIVYDGDLSLSEGAFQIQNGHNNTDTAGNIAAGYLTDLNGYTGPLASLAALRHDGRQDQLVAVPSPAAAAGGLVLLGGLLVQRRR